MPHCADDIELVFRPSRYWSALTLSGASLVLMACLQLQFVWLQLLMSGLLAIYLTHIFCRYYWRSLACSVKALRYCNGRWWIKKTDGIWIEVTIKEPSMVSAFLTVISFKLSRYQQESVAIFPDSTDKNAYRRLRVLLGMNHHNAKEK